MDKILGIGNVLVDVLAVLDNDLLLDELNLPKGSMQLIDDEMLRKVQEKFASLPTHRATGGAACNTIAALAKLGASVGLIGKIGEDENGCFFSSTLQSYGVQTNLLESHLPTGIAFTFISPCGERTFCTYLGAASTLKAEDLLPEMFEGYTYFYIEGYLLQDHDLILRAMQLAKQAGLQICLDMASYNIVEEERDFFKLLIERYVDIVFANESEARAYTKRDPMEALDEIASMCSVAIIKTGKEGSLIKKGTEFVKVSPFPVEKVVDTTGAGDFYAAGFLYGLTCGCSLKKCAQISSVLAGQVIQTVGTELQPGQWNEIKLNIDMVLHAEIE